MDLPTIALLLVPAALLAVVVWLVLRLRRDVASLRASDPSSGLLVLQSQLDTLREQVRASLEGGRLELDQRLAETNRVVGEVRQGLGQVDRQVRSVSEAARDIRSLQELMRAPKIRGGMGEFLLADLLSEVLPSAHYTLQHGFPGGERVDAAIRIGQRLVPVDAKFPLENFRRTVEAKTEADEKSARRAFRADVRKHVDAIATRYVRPGEGTYDFAMMYIPAESVYHEAILREDDSGADLFRYAISRRVIPVSPQSFYAYLQVVVLGLRGLSIEERAQEIMNRLGLIRSRVDRFTESFDVAVRHLGNAQSKLDEAGRRLAKLDAALGDLEARPEDAEATDPDAVSASAEERR